MNWKEINGNLLKAAFICDLKSSRKIERWSEIIASIKNQLNQLNRQFASFIEVPFRFTVGDEFQGVLSSVEGVVPVFRWLRYNLPVEFYCGCGIGSVEYAEKDFSTMRGSAFYRARDSIEYAKRKNRKFLLNSNSEEVDMVVNGIYFLIQVIESRWTNRQRELASFYMLNEKLTYDEIGRRFGISKQAVSKHLRAAGVEAILEGEEVILSQLSKLKEK